jgi:hypothetical protein
MADKKFLHEIEEAVVSALTPVGFRRLPRGAIVCELASNFLGWVGLNRGNHGSMVRINPFVGVHATDVMKLVAKLDGERYVPGALATYAIHLGELLPDELTFEFHVGESLTDEANRLAGHIANTAVDYMKSIAGYGALLPLVEHRMPLLGGYPERYAAILHLSGRTEAAREFVSGVLARRESLARYSSDSFARFGQNFLDMSD